MDKETLSLVLDTIYENAYNDGYNDCKNKAKKYINELKESYKNGNELQKFSTSNPQQSTTNG